MQVSLGCHVEGIALPHPNPDSALTAEAGVRKRFLFLPPKPNPKLLAELSQFVLEWCQKNLTPLSPDADTSVETWLHKAHYPQSRRKELHDLWMKNNCTLRPKDYRVKSFVKDETYPSYKHARGINSRSDMFKCAFGPICRLIEEQVYKHPAFIKKIPVNQRPKYLKDMLYREGAKYFWADFSAFESHFTKEILESIEFVMYSYMTKHLPGGSEFMRLCHEVIAGDNECVYKYFRVRCKAKRMSGEMNTSLGNGFTNLMLILFLFKRLGEDVTPVVEGDDSNTSFMNHYPTADDFAQLGFTIDKAKSGVSDNFEEMSFCGMIFDQHDLVNVTDPTQVLASFGWAKTPYSRASYSTKMKLLRCKSLSYAYQYPGCPIIQDLAKYGLFVTRSYDVRHMIYESRLIPQWDRHQLILAYEAHVSRSIPNVEVPYRTRLLVDRLFGITPGTQAKVENYLSNLRVLTPLSGPVSRLIEYPPDWYHYYDNYSLEIDRSSRNVDHPSCSWSRLKNWKPEWEGFSDSSKSPAKTIN